MPNELTAFHAFVREQIQAGQEELLPEEVLEMWREQHPDPAMEDATEEIREALDDFEKGDRGRPVEEFLRDFRRRNNIP